MITNIIQFNKINDLKKENKKVITVTVIPEDVEIVPLAPEDVLKSKITQ